jgi:hypothetical protein
MCDNWGCTFALFNLEGHHVSFHITRGLLADLHARWRDPGEASLQQMFEDSSADIAFAANLVYSRQRGQAEPLDVDAASLREVGAL